MKQNIKSNFFFLQAVILTFSPKCHRGYYFKDPGNVWKTRHANRIFIQ